MNHDPALFAEIKSLSGEPTPNPEVATDLTVMQAVAYVAGLPRSTRPACTNLDLAAFLEGWSADLADSARDELLLPLVPELVGAKRGPSNLFAQLALSWLLRDAVPSWLAAAGSTTDVYRFANEMPPPVSPQALSAWLAALHDRTRVFGDLKGTAYGTVGQSKEGIVVARYVAVNWNSTGEQAAAGVVRDAFGVGAIESEIARSAMHLCNLGMMRSALASVSAAIADKHRDPVGPAIRLHDAFRRMRQESAIRLVRRMLPAPASARISA